jgi:hypothetical protein
VLKKIFSKKLHKIFGVIEKLLTPLHKQINKNMLRKQSHIEALNGWSPIGDFTVCGACYADE